MIRRPPRSTLSSSSAASDVYKRQIPAWCRHFGWCRPIAIANGRWAEPPQDHHGGGPALPLLARTLQRAGIRLTGARGNLLELYDSAGPDGSRGAGAFSGMDGAVGFGGSPICSSRSPTPEWVKPLRTCPES